MLAPDSLGSAVAAAAAFLIREQAADGSWKDFLLPAGPSDLWVTGYTGYALARAALEGARSAGESGWHFLRRSLGKDGGWSYNATVPEDADSTLWGLRCGEALAEQNTPAARSASEFLEMHLRNDGGVATYHSSGPICAYVGLPPVMPFAGWTQSHICVTAAAANLGSFRDRLTAYLLRRQRRDGSWPAYWWFDDEYATAEAVTALAGRSGAEAALKRACDWALGREQAVLKGGSFALALWIRILLACDSDEARAAAARGLNRLLYLQRADGSWAPSARLRVPRPDAIQPNPAANWRPWKAMPSGPVSPATILENTFTIYSLDHGARFTTATVLNALLDAQQRDLACATSETTGEFRYV